MHIQPSKFVLHFREHQEFLWESNGELVWARAHVFIGTDRLELNSRGVRYWNDGRRPPQILDVSDRDWTSRILTVSADITEPLEAREVHVVTEPLIATPIARFIVTGPLTTNLAITTLSRTDDRTVIETDPATAEALRAQGYVVEEHP